jgi:hypothetical protein
LDQHGLYRRVNAARPDLWSGELKNYTPFGLKYSLAINIDFGSVIQPPKVMFCQEPKALKTSEVVAPVLYATKR